MLHLIKLAVGVRDIPHLRALQAARAVADPPLRHRTRSTPRRRPEIVDAGGSIFWVVAGVVAARQRILDIRPDTWDDGRDCAALLLDPAVVPVRARAMKPFQGWRYLDAAAASADFGAAEAADAAGLPPAL
ncbi:MAG TPA: DUF1489 family protein, partial [Acetobacteraceae bacterium]|nr:DUF1489 family protein [Acetobacteraceae bacterium]